jgi:uncharacterized protein YhdP
VRVVINPDLAQAPDTILAAQIDAQADVSDLLAWQAVEMSLPVSGITAVSVAVNVADAISVGISSELRGVMVDMPLPWGKSDQASAPLQVIWRDRDWAAWEIFWFGRFSAVVDAPDLGELAANFDVTPRTRPPKSIGMSPKPGLGVTGHLPSLDLADWEPFIKSLSGSSSKLAILPEYKTFGLVAYSGKDRSWVLWTSICVQTPTNCRWIYPCRGWARCTRRRGAWGLPRLMVA